MASPILSVTEGQLAYLRPTSVLMLRTPVPPSQGTDPYHDTFGPFCLPSFPFSALESGSSTPLPPTLNLTTTSEGRTGADLLRNALNASRTGKRHGRWIDDDGSLTTHHLSSEPDDSIGQSGDGSGELPKREFCVTSITVLGHRLVNVEQLTDKLLNGADDRDGVRKAYRGAILTSQRAVEAWMEAALGAAEPLRKGVQSNTTWPRTPVFAVGSATAEATRAAAKKIVQPVRPALVMGGGATGTGEALASYIIRHFNGPSGAAPGDALDVEIDTPPLLYLTGDKNASTISDMLGQANPPISVETLMVYETSLDSNFTSSCSALSRSLPPAPQSRPGSRRGSRSNSQNNSRRPSMNSLFSSLMAEQLERKRSTNATDNGDAGDVIASSRGPPMTAMTPFTMSPTQELSQSPIDDSIELPLDTDIGLGTGTGTKPDWIVFFSPSGIEYTIDDLRRRRWLPGPYTFDPDAQEYAKDSPESIKRGERWLSMGPPLGFPRLAVIGPTTKKWVRQNLGYLPDAVAASPGPTELREAIRMAEKRVRRERERDKATKEFTERQRKEEKARLVGVADGGGVPMEMD